MKKLMTMFFALTLMGGMLFSCGNKNSGEKKVAIVKLGTHTSLDEINDAIKNTLTSYDKVSITIQEYNAAFSSDTANTIMQTIKNDVDVVVAIATPVAQAAYNVIDEKTPIVFAAVSDPIGAKLVTSLDKPTENITGTSDEIQVDLILDKALEIDPNLKKLGFIYNPNEDNSITNKGKIEAYCKNKNIELISSTIQNAGEMSEVASVLVKKVDAVFITDDNTVASSMSVLGEICRDEKIPCYTGADSEVKDGGMLCVGINYTDLGNATGNMVIDIIEGKKIKDIPVKVFKNNLKIYLNTSYVEEAEINLPKSILEDANLVEIKE